MFKKGDKVETIEGAGVVTQIITLDEFNCCMFPDLLNLPQVQHKSVVVVTKESGELDYYTQDGLNNKNNKYPSIWHTETGSPPKVGHCPVWIPEKPTPCFVWNNSDDQSGETVRLKRVVVAHNSAGYSILYGAVRYDNAEPLAHAAIPPEWHWPHPSEEVTF